MRIHDYRIDGPESSREAADNRRDTAEAQRQIDMVLQYVTDNPGSTSSELADMAVRDSHGGYHALLHVFRRRLTDLSQAGQIIKGGIRKTAIEPHRSELVYYTPDAAKGNFDAPDFVAALQKQRAALQQHIASLEGKLANLESILSVYEADYHG